MYNMLKNNFNTLIQYTEYNLSIVTLNIFIYTIVLYGFFSLFFVFDIKYIKTLNELKSMNYIESVSLLLILGFLSVAGIPPLAGFSGKFLLFIYFTSKTNVFIIVIFIIFSLFAMFFYIQNTRFIVSKEPKNYFIFRNNCVTINSTLVNLLIIFNVFNVICIFYISDMLLVFDSIFSQYV